MELPDLVRETLGEEDVVAGLRLGDEDLVVFTGSRTVLYRGEGLLSDEDVSTYPFDFERLRSDRSRRKATFTLSYMDDERDFSVPRDRGQRVLERLVEGSLRVPGVVEPDEAVTGVFRFSELTLAVAEGRLLKHVGEYTWDGDFEVFDYEDLTKLDFEEGSVATQVVLGTGGGRTERIKAPNQEAGAVRKALQKAVFAYHGVDSLEALNRAIEPEETGGTTDAQAGLGLESGIDPLVGDSDGAEDGATTGTGGTTTSESSGIATPEPGGTPASEPDGTTTPESGGTAAPDEAGGAPGRQSSDHPTGGGSSAGRDAAEEFAALDAGVDAVEGGDDASLAAVTDQLADLTAAIERQNELLSRQQRTVQQLVEDLQRGR